VLVCEYQCTGGRTVLVCEYQCTGGRTVLVCEYQCTKNSGQKKKYKRTNNDQQNIYIKLMIG
jgi:hypothetical protein